MTTTTTTNSWLERIAEAEERPGFTVADMSDVTSWPSCAVGEAVGARLGCNADAILVSPFEDSLLCELGLHFAEAVLRNHYVEARDLHQRIGVEAGRL